MVTSLGLGSSPLFIGSGIDYVQDDSTPPAKTDPAVEYIAVDRLSAELEEWGFDRYCHFHRKQPLPILRAMSRTPPVQASASVLFSTVLSGGAQIVSAVRPSDDSKPDPDQELALQLVEECKRATARLDTPLETSMWEALNAILERVKLWEHPLIPVVGGVDAGNYTLAGFKFKPRWSWRFRVDRAMNVVGIDCWTVNRKWETLDPDHFGWFAWNGVDSDPRGDSVLDAAYPAFQMLTQLWPEALVGWKQFGTPSIFYTTGESAMRDVPVRDSTGTPTGKTISAEKSMANMLIYSQKNGSQLVAMPGATAKVLESSRSGDTISSAISILEAQMIICVLLQTRATTEAKFGSRADAENGTGVVGTFAQSIRSALCASFRKPYRMMIEANHGPDIAARLTPLVTLGKIDARNFAAIVQAIGVLFQSGYFTEAQLMWVDEFCGLPIRRHDEERVGPQKDNATPPGDPSKALDNPATVAMLAQVETMLIERGMPS